jgi:HSP20 family molecular chaperone IbpA
VIDIPVNGNRPEDIQVEVRGDWILLKSDRSRQETREDSFDQGRGYARSYSFSSGVASRRFMLPPDADVGALTREEVDGTLRIRIPRRLP